MVKWGNGTIFRTFWRTRWFPKPSLVSEENKKVAKNSKVRNIVVAPISFQIFAQFVEFGGVVWLVKKKSNEKSWSAKIVAVPIFCGKSTKNDTICKMCNCVQSWAHVAKEPEALTKLSTNWRWTLKKPTRGTPHLLGIIQRKITGGKDQVCDTNFYTFYKNQ